MKHAAHKGIQSEVEDVTNESTSKSQYLNNKNDHEQKVQEIIDLALLEMNNGNYEEAISLLNKAQELYDSSRAMELQELITKLQISACKTSESKETSNSKTLYARQRKYSNPEKNILSQEYKSQTDFTNEQLDLVKKTNNCKNYYQVLSVSREATDSEIKKAYKKLALHLHPDKNHAPGAVEAFKTLGNAVATLSDANKRKEYDLSGGNHIKQSGSSCNSFKSNSSSYHQYYNHTNEHNYYNNTSTFKAGEEFTSEEWFHIFFGNYSSTQGQYRRRPYHYANQSQPHEQGQQPSLALGLLLVMILMSIFMSLFSTDPLYSLSRSRKYSVRCQTQHLSVPYYVKENFDNDYQGSLARLENAVEEDYVYTMKQHCFRERSYREAMMARARTFGSRAQFAQAQGLTMPSCDNLSKIGITRYSLY